MTSAPSAPAPFDEVGKVAGATGAGGGADSLGRHIGVGAYNSVNALALAAGGASLVDRSVVDVLGVAGAAQVLARRLNSDLTPEEMDQVRQARAIGLDRGDYQVERAECRKRTPRVTGTASQLRWTGLERAAKAAAQSAGPEEYPIPAARCDVDGVTISASHGAFASRKG